ncbi:2-hydroxychromene-2-carboxylate isomerase [Luteimonas suaedae]|uniref:2-hydroxychromene-2-carboxylate isomerase n=1 Tax=Luteimonas suaedae TaxID=2605430 RepID=UPI0011EFEAB9|nr:2-hydroxychromene-2-carboxylate isomerase [Luteimonas suaedae]
MSNRRTIDYYFSLISPWSYLGHAALHEVARAAGAAIDYRPVRIIDLFAANGGVPLGQRAPARQRYRLIELQRWRAARGLPLNLSPKHYPLDIALADRVAIALAERGEDPAGYTADAYRALWAEDRDLADRDVLAALLAERDHDAAAVLAAADGEAAGACYRRNTEMAIAADLPGLPGYVVDGEPFWGQDRIEQLQAMLAEGRPPLRGG